MRILKVLALRGPNIWSRHTVLEAWVEQSVRARDSDVGGQCQIESRAHGGTIDRGDRGQLAAADGHEAGVDALQAVARCSPQGGQICTGTEGFPCSGDNDGVDGVVCFGPMHRVTQLGGHALGDRVSALGIVDGDNGNSVADVIENQFSHEA